MFRLWAELGLGGFPPAGVRMYIRAMLATSSIEMPGNYVLTA
uniref:Uncharacterized protein n=1 Tax=Myoviridae sp. ctxi06 TaxID=2826713 RepID=A0A8S5R3E1_9CAUD|nr:MAG TPA: hypothetical protein [Myoviridae sp. ctxi06]DAR55197.1 MAG TPA: hypothetical protein [Caudoviricetes sp.]